MFKFFSICVLLGAGCIAAVVYGAKFLPAIPQMAKADEGGERENEQPRQVKDRPRDVGEEKSSGVSSSSSRYADKEVRVFDVPASVWSQPLIIQEGRVLTAERQEVPCERDGKLMLVATPVGRNEWVPDDKVRWLDISVMGVEYKPGDDLKAPLGGNKVAPIAEPFEDPRDPEKKLYRFPRPTDSLAPGTTKVVQLRIKFRVLTDGEEVKEGQLVGVINPASIVQELESRQTKVAAAVAEVKASESMHRESQIRLKGIRDANLRRTGAVSRDDEGAAEVTVEKYYHEIQTKRANVVQVQQELLGAWTTLDQCFIRAMISGKIRTFYKSAGDGVKNLDPVMLLQNPKKLRVEAQVETQDSLLLLQRIKRAEALRAKAGAIDATQSEEAKKLRAQADAETKVFVEVTRAVPPKFALEGDLSPVNCVAIARGATTSRIVSGSELGIVRIWEYLPHEDRWVQKNYITHSVPVRALACTGAKASNNYLVTATSTGRIQRFKIDEIHSTPLVLGQGEARHTGTVNVLAINADGTRCVSGGEDRAIMLWDLETGKLIARKSSAHNNIITTLAFTPDGKIVSAGRDGKINVWQLNEEQRLTMDGDPVEGRSNDIAQLGLNPAGDKILFDAGRELRVVSLADKSRGAPEGSMINPNASGTFTTLALFSPDGNTILTNSNTTGRLQLWRAPSATTRAAELQQLLWTSGSITCGSFDPAGNFAVTGTSDHRILVWDLPKKEEAEKPLEAQLTYVEEFLDTTLRKVAVRATLTDAKDWVIPGSTASIVVPSKVR